MTHRGAARRRGGRRPGIRGSRRCRRGGSRRHAAVERGVKLAPFAAGHHRPGGQPHRRQHPPMVTGSAGNISPSRRHGGPVGLAALGRRNGAGRDLLAGIVQHRAGEHVLGLGMGRNAEARHVDADDAHAVDLLGSSAAARRRPVGTQRLVTTMASKRSGSAISCTLSRMSSNSLPVTSVSELKGTYPPSAARRRNGSRRSARRRSRPSPTAPSPPASSAARRAASRRRGTCSAACHAGPAGSPRIAVEDLDCPAMRAAFSISVPEWQPPSAGIARVQHRRLGGPALGPGITSTSAASSYVASSLMASALSLLGENTGGAAGRAGRQPRMASGLGCAQASS